MKILMKISLLAFLIIVIVGCNGRKDEVLSYEAYRDEFFRFNSEFNPDGYIDITGDTYTSVTASFPSNNLGGGKIDALDDDIQFPYRYETYYVSEDDTILVYVNYIYHPENTENKFLTIYGVSNNINSNISEEYQTLLRPLLKEYLISVNGYLVDIKFIGISQKANQEYVTEKYSEFSLKCVDFYSQFEDTLLAIIEKRSEY
jgi:hypothetical protein